MNCFLSYMITSCCSVIITTADVTIDNIVDLKVDITNAGLLERTRVTTTVDNEIDNIMFEWNDTMRSTAFTDFYKTLFVTVTEQSFISTLTWAPDTTPEERKQAGGAVLCKAVSGDIVLGTITFAISVVWPPGNSILTLQKYPLTVGKDEVQLTCTLTEKGNPDESQVYWIKNGLTQTGADYNRDMITFDAEMEHDEDQWNCNYENNVGSGTLSNNVTLDVQWTPGTASLSIDQNPLNVSNSARLRCDVTQKGNPVGEARWLKKMKGQSQYNGQRSITFVVDKNQDKDDWKCYFTNDVDDGEYSDVVILDIHYKPDDAKIMPDTKEPKLGDSLTFTCGGDNGNPDGRVLWYLNSSIYGNTTSKQLIIDNVDVTYQGNWSCLFYNTFGDGGSSSNIEIQVVLTPLPPKNVSLTRRTTVSFGITVNLGTVPITVLPTYTGMNITLYPVNDTSGNTTNIFPVVSSEYIIEDLAQDENYTIEVSLINHLGNGATYVIYGKTKRHPINPDPAIERSWLSALAKIEVINPDSVARVELSVCASVGDMDCVNGSTTDIQEDMFEFGVKETSFSGRYVTLYLYDEGLLIFTHSDNIEAPVAAIVVIVFGCILIIGLIVVIIVVIIKKQGKGTETPRKDVETYSNPVMANSQTGTGTGHESHIGNDPPVYSVVNKSKPLLAPIAAAPADGAAYSQVDWSKKTNQQSLKGLPMSKKAIAKILFSTKDGYINMHLEVSKKFSGDIETCVCRQSDQSRKSTPSKQHVRATKNAIIVLPIEETSQDKYQINMKFIAKGQMVQEVDLTYPYDQNAVNVTVLNEAYVTSGSGDKAQEMPEYSEVKKSKKTKGSEMPIYSDVNKPKKKKKAAEEEPYEDVETKNQSSHNDGSTNAVSPSNAEVAVEGVPSHPPRKGAQKEGVMYAELDLNNSGAPRLLPRLGSKSPAHEPVVYADVRPG